MRRTSMLVLIVVLILGLAVLSIGCGTSDQEEKKTTPATSPKATAPKSQPATTPSQQPFQQQTFENIKSAHYVSSDPANNALLTTPPQTVSISFNFNLGTNNWITVKKDGVSVVTGGLTIAPDKLSMSVPVNANATGNYLVDYQASWPDGSYHFGSFGFSVQLP